MARIRMLHTDELDPELRALVAADDRTPLELGNIRIYAHRPELAKGYVALTSATRAHRSLPARLLELVRLRVAFHNQCRSCMAVRYAGAVADGVTEELVCSLERPEEADDLTDAERAALRFADLFANNHLAIDDVVLDDLRRHFSEPEIVELGMNVAMFVGFGRLSAVWHMVDELPERFQDDAGGSVTPWGPDAIVVR